MKKYIIITLALLLIAKESQAQKVAGYQGKRFFVEAGGTFLPNIPINYTTPLGAMVSINRRTPVPPLWLNRSTTYTNQGVSNYPNFEDSKDYIVSSRYNISLNYVWSNMATFKLGYDYSRAGTIAIAYTTPVNNTGLNNNTSINNYDRHLLFYQLHIHDFNLSLSLLNPRKGGIAPMGLYWDFSLRFLSVHGVLKDQEVNYAYGIFPDNKPRTAFLNPTGIKPHTFMLGFSAKYGYRAVIADKITLNVGLELTLFANQLVFLDPNVFDLRYGNYKHTYQESVVVTVGSRYLLGIHLGVGYLIF